MVSRSGFHRVVTCWPISLAPPLGVTVFKLIIYPVFIPASLFSVLIKEASKVPNCFFLHFSIGLNIVSLLLSIFFSLNGSEEYKLKRRPCAKKMPIKQNKNNGEKFHPNRWEKTKSKTHNVERRHARTHAHTCAQTRTYLQACQAIWPLWSS